MEVCLEVEKRQTGWESIRQALELRIRDQDQLIGNLRETFPEVDAYLNGKPYKVKRRAAK
jgi:hypothetical protein